MLSDAAMKYGLHYESLPESGFSDTVRDQVHETKVVEWSAESEGLVVLSDWLPLAE